MQLICNKNGVPTEIIVRNAIYDIVHHNLFIRNRFLLPHLLKHMPAIRTLKYTLTAIGKSHCSIQSTGKLIPENTSAHIIPIIFHHIQICTTASWTFNIFTHMFHLPLVHGLCLQYHISKNRVPFIGLCLTTSLHTISSHSNGKTN